MAARAEAEKIIVAPKIRDLEKLGQQLAIWLAPRLGQPEALQISNLAYPSGAGMSHETILFDATWIRHGKTHTQGMVVRIKPIGHPVYPDDLYESQYRLMQILHERDWAPVAEILWVEQDPSLLGAPFFVMKKLYGRVAVTQPPYAKSGWLAEATPRQRRKLWENGVRQLALLQKIPTDELGFLADPDGKTGFEQEWAKYERFVAWVSEAHRWPVLDAALADLRERWPANRPPGLVWGDARLGNLMVGEDFEILAVMDWEQPSLGGALHDLAWWVTNAGMMHGHETFPGMGSRAETIALWEEITGISAAELRWYEDFTVFKMSCLSITTSRIKNGPEPDHAWLAKRLNFSGQGGTG